MQTNNFQLIFALGALFIGIAGMLGIIISLYFRTKAVNEIKHKTSEKSAKLYLDRFPTLWGDNSSTKEIKRISPHIEMEINLIIKSQKIFWVSFLFICLGGLILMHYPFGR